jgi:hypothetical protein
MVQCLSDEKINKNQTIPGSLTSPGKKIVFEKMAYKRLQKRDGSWKAVATSKAAIEIDIDYDDVITVDDGDDIRRANGWSDPLPKKPNKRDET